MVQQYVYGPEHIDELVLIFGENGTHFVYQDDNWNTMGLTNSAGDVVEECNYTPYGRAVFRRHTAFGDLDGDGDVDSTDQTTFNAAYGSSVGDGNWDRDCDADYDGDVDSFDQSAFNKSYNAAAVYCPPGGLPGIRVRIPAAPVATRDAPPAPTRAATRSDSPDGLLPAWRTPPPQDRHPPPPRAARPSPRAQAHSDGNRARRDGGPAAGPTQPR